MHLLSWSAAIVAGFLGVVAPAGGQIAIIVNRANPVRDISIADLRRLYLGQTTTFPGGERVTLTVAPALNESFCQKVLGMETDLVQRHWMAVVFRGDDASPPETFETAAQVRSYVAQHRGAIGFVDAQLVDGSVKALTLNGIPFGDPRYRLR
jgi:ABC-type phosphate transport system substrate-binding protein